MKKIGITTTVPVEIVLAAGYRPVDLNNLFVSAPSPEKLVNIAERDGFPLNICSWIKGIYGTCKEYGIDKVICVTTGDCSNTIMLMEVLKLKGFNVTQFAFPAQPDTGQMQEALTGLADALGTTLPSAEKIRQKLVPARNKVLKLDELTWKTGQVSGYENHYWLVSASDFNQDYRKYKEDIRLLLDKCRRRRPYSGGLLRLAYIGVPSVFARDLYNYIEANGARVVFNETQHQFAMPYPGKSLADQYTNYTYPYSIYGRVNDIQNEINKRRIDGIIHYVQAFCHRGIGDIIFRESFNLPVLTLEGNQDFYLTQHVKTRIEAFLDMIKRGRRE